ncbi:MAG: acetamidase/formamidase family protein [Prochlorothrix sp.]|nr:acetamidase/formamidase family protein [Prochlorothrix sp.]
MTTHILKATPDTVHLGGFSPDLRPVLRVESGDRIDIETFTGYSFALDAPAAFAPPELVAIRHHLPEAQKVGIGPHLLTGPIAIAGAEPGDVVAIHLDAIQPRLPMGFNVIRPGMGALPYAFSEFSLRFLELDLECMEAEFPPQSGIKVPLRPFFGILAVAPTESCSSIPPGIFGGNLDNRHLQAGSTLYLPVQVPEALVSIGDGHSAQGDGEVNVTAIETAMNGTVRLTLHKATTLPQPLRQPFAETPHHWMAMGFDYSLDGALHKALEQMLQFLQDYLGLSPEEAYVLCSIGINFNITQVVNTPLKGVHGLLPKAILPQPIAFLGDRHG